MNRAHLSLSLICLSLSACQVDVRHDADSFGTTADLDGVWQGVLSTESKHETLQGHMLDGLLLSVDLDTGEAHSAEMVLDQGELAGIFARRGPAGEREQDYTVLGSAEPYERIEADLLGEQSDARLSLFYAERQTFDGASYAEVEGLYAYYGDQLQVTLSIGYDGTIEGYDDAGCAYFGALDVPDFSRNVYAVSLEVDGCALAGDYGYGLGSLEYGGFGDSALVLPIWFDDQDRVEAWYLQRI